MTDAPARTPWWRRVPAPVVAALVAFVVYLPSLGGGFLYDDNYGIVENRQIRDLSDIGTVVGYEPSRPLLNLTWALNYAAGGLTPWPWHLVNIALHAANTALVASLFLWMAVRLRRPHAAAAALLGACFFAATPMAAETVAYVSSRSTALATLLSLASLRVAAPALESGSWRRLGAGLGLLLVALAAKEDAAAVPLLLLLIDVVVVAQGRLGETAKRLGRHAPFLALIPLGLVARRLVTGAWLPAAPMDRGHYLLTQLAEFPGYLLRAVVPLDPALYRGVPAVPWPPDLATVLWVALGVGLILGAFVVRSRLPLVALAVLWMAAGLSPSSSLVPLREMVVDHRAYLGGVGVCFALGVLIWKPGRLVLALALVAVLGGRAVLYQRVLADPVRAWSDAVARAPESADARVALAEAHVAAGDMEAAAREFTETQRVDPGNVRAAVNLGTFLAMQSRYEDAARWFRIAARGAPEDARVRDNLGMILQALGREEEALEEFEAAVAGQPALAQPRINLAALLLARGERERAAALLDEAAGLEIDEHDAAAIEELRATLR